MEETTSHNRGPEKCQILQDLQPEVSVEIGGYSVSSLQGDFHCLDVS